MKFRPCIDLRSGKVTQIVGATLVDNNTDAKSSATSADTNFVTDRSSASYAEMYKRDGLTGGHVIMLGPGNEEAARQALAAYPGGLQIGGGITPATAGSWMKAGASHVIVTSYAFSDGTINYDRLAELTRAAGGKNRVVLDLSCRRRPGEASSDGKYYVVTDRWQTFTDIPVDENTLRSLSEYCAEFLVHGVEAEGRRCGIMEDLVEFLGAHCPIPVTYAGGARGMGDLERVNELGGGRVDLTIGTALDCFGGDVKYDGVVAWHKANNSA